MDKMLEKQIQMVDLRKQYERLRSEIDPAMQTVINACAFINGPQVKGFCNHLSDYLGIPYAIPCGNGTDALQISLMAFDLHPGDEVIVPAFTYIAAAEVALALGLVPVLVDVDPGTFNIDPEKIEDALSEKTRAIIAVHLFGQCCDMESILSIAGRHNLYVIEDNAQSIGANYTFSEGTVKKAGRLYRYDLFLPLETVGLLWRWWGDVYFRRTIGRTTANDRQSWAKGKISSCFGGLQLPFGYLAGRCLRC